MVQHIDSNEISPEVMDTQEEKLRKSLLIFAAAFMTFAVMLWLAIYWMMGLNFSSNVPLGYQAISVGSLVYYMQTRNFEVLRFVQLTLFLFAPFIMQWSIGSSVTSSGVALWALLAPIGALVVSGWKESIPWFFAYIVLTAVSGFFDFYLGAGTATGIPMNTIGVFFALNFAAMSSILYFLVRYFVHRDREDQEPARPAACLAGGRAEEIGAGAVQRVAFQHRRAPEEQPGPDRRRLCRCDRDVCRPGEFHPAHRTDVAGADGRAAEYGVFRFRRTFREIRSGEDQDHRRCLYGGGRAVARTAGLCRRHGQHGDRDAGFRRQAPGCWSSAIWASTSASPPARWWPA